MKNKLRKLIDESAKLKRNDVDYLFISDDSFAKLVTIEKLLLFEKQRIKYIGEEKTNREIALLAELKAKHGD